ncbi:hypothetical protein B0H65DRAFT_552879 [Neurospora tetraspora]|uniref:RING-type E3 ubiquitin transferase n=1 Tax=Neurospora tetraspora TaxID=94610 RepID=A0AAE0J8C5_9PEZI|nr:hypothetical protein B0H65DRAFT_552879 [Neurospora tetraspora]
MASPGRPQRHLDATTGREVVYCYGCENEWYRDDYPHLDLECPRCHNDFVQIVEPDNDPRPGVQQQGPRSDSDPDEDDIEEFLERGPGSFFMRRSVYHSPESPFQSPFNRPSGNGVEDLDSSPDRPRARPDDSGEAVLSRFADMFAELGGARPGQQGGNAFGTQPRIQRTTFTRSGDGMASFTFTTTTTTGGAAGDGPEVPAFDTYVRSRHGNPGIRRHTIIVVTNGRANSNGDGSLFRGLFGNIPSPGAEDPGGGPGQGGGPRGPPLGFAAGLQEFIATLLNPQAAVHGDAVYTQEALDRIITTLMEANPQSNAAPPATQSAIEKLPKKILDEQMVGPEGKAECTICIDEMYKGEEATVLPCKHWFHGECVTLWLKEHNTCPICRMPIEGNNQTGSNSNRNNNSQPSASRQEASTSSSSAFASSTAPGRNPFESLNPFGPQGQLATERLRRSEQEREERLERIRNVAGVRRTDSQSEGISRRTSHSPPSRENSSFNMRSRVRDPSPPRDRGTSTAWQNSSSNSQSNISSRYSGGLGNLWGRTNSNSGQGSSRDRDGQREGGGQQQQNQQQQQQSSSSGNGALGWLRDHFGRGSSGSGSGSDRDRERRR